MRTSAIISFPALLLASCMYVHADIQEPRVRRFRGARDVNDKRLTQSTRPPLFSTKSPLFCDDVSVSTRRLHSTSKSPKSVKAVKATKSKSPKSKSPKSLKSTKSSKSSSKSKKSKKGSQPNFTHIYEVFMQTGTICGDNFNGGLSDEQSETIVDIILEVADDMPEVKIHTVNIVDYEPAACCSTANPEVDCLSASEEDQQSSVELTMPVECGEMCPELPDTIGGIDAGMVISNELAASGIIIAGNPLYDMSSVITEIATECQQGMQKCSNSSTCCGVADGCICNNVSESYCDVLGCTIDANKGCCRYDICADK